MIINKRSIDLKESYLHLLFSISVILCIFVEFFLQNYQQIDAVIIIDTSKWLFVLIMAPITLFFIKKKLMFKISVLIYFFFKFDFLKITLKKFNLIFDGEISLVILVILSYLFLKYYNNLQKFFQVFFLIYLIGLTVNFIFLYSTQFSIKKNIETKVKYNFFNSEELSKINNKRNIYLIILDEMTSLEEFKKYYNDINIYDVKEKLSSYNLHYIDGSKSVFTTSYLTFSSIFNLQPIVTENSKKYENRDNFFPQVLLKNKNHPNYPILIKTLNQINYRLIWIGTAWADCARYDSKLCFSYDETTGKKNLRIDYVLNTNISNVDSFFYSQTPLKPIIFNLNNLIIKEKKYFQWEYEANNGIGKFLKASKYFDPTASNRKNFFFIHHNSPHFPYVYNEDCSERIDDTHIKNNYLGYKMAYMCNLKRIQNFMNFINNKDPSAIVIIQGDHGFEFDPKKNLSPNGFTKENARKRLEHFNALKVPNNCKKYLTNRIGNINAVRLALSCAVGLKPKLIEEKHYVGFYETQRGYGKVIEYKNFK
jgi:hypothetical protein